MTYEKVVAVYDSVTNANAAVKSLTSSGYLADDISVIRNEGEAEKAGLYEPGIWKRLFGRDLEHEEAAVLGRSLAQGSTIISVRVPESEALKVMSLLDRQKPVDVVDRAKAYGLVGATAAAPLAPSATLTASILVEERSLPVAEEELSVGKRMVESGHTRVRRYVIEKPVEASITLHEEHVEVIRRAISDPTYLKDIDWSDKAIDMTETLEEPVISKTAHITEEIVIRKQGSDHKQTVHDTVRRQEIEIDQIPVGTGTKKDT